MTSLVSLISCSLGGPSRRAYGRRVERTGSSADRYSATRYFALAREGLIAPDDRTELLEGIIVSMPPQDPLHAAGVRQLHHVLQRILGLDVVLSSQLPFIASEWSVPEPDLAVLPGRLEDYHFSHPTHALLVVEVANTSLAQDRLTKSRIYAKARIPTYWIVNVRERSVEWFEEPDADARLYRSQGVARGSTRLPLRAFAEAVVLARDLLPVE
jgi:Uma2 family endonuclease